MNKLIKIVGKVSLFAITGFIFSSCTSNPDSSGLEYMPDMYRSPAVEPYVDYGELRGRFNTEVSNKLSALTPPRNTIPYFGTNREEVLMMLPYLRKPSQTFGATHGLFDWDYTKNTEADYEYLQAASDVNPVKLTKDNSEKIFKTGKELYVAYCLHCHGEKGDGNGPMVASGAYAGVPNYADKTTLADGQMFYSIYYGKGAMGSHSSLVNKKEIWTLVHYIHKLQNAEYGTFNAEGSLTTPSTIIDSTHVKVVAEQKPIKK